MKIKEKKGEEKEERLGREGGVREEIKGGDLKQMSEGVRRRSEGGEASKECERERGVHSFIRPLGRDDDDERVEEVR